MAVPSYVPKDGWTQDTFETRAGLRMLNAWFDNAAHIRGAAVKDYSKLLDRQFDKFFEEVFRNVEEAAARTGRKATFIINPEGDQRLWAQAIEDALVGFDAEVVVTGSAAYTATTVTTFEMATGLLGVEPTDAAIRALTPRITTIASRVTSISNTTRSRLGRYLRHAIYEAEMTVAETVKYIRSKIPSIAKNRIPTIARTEMGNACDEATKAAIQASETVEYVGVIGCEAVEPGIPTFNGVPTCNIQWVPAHSVGQLQFHINHTGVIIPSGFTGAPSRTPSTGTGDPEDLI